MRFAFIFQTVLLLLGVSQQMYSQNTSRNVLFIAVSVFLCISGLCGLLILLKRIFNKRLKSISVPDDYFSNLITTGLHFILVSTLIFEETFPTLLLYTSFILLYMTVGKLRHAVYFISARIYLGVFYGFRGVWPKSKLIKH